MATASEHPVAAILLAAGRSRRFGRDNKLLADIGGEPLVRRTARTLLASRARPVIVVTGFERERLAAALAGLDLGLVHNPSYEQGLGASLARGIDAVPGAAAGAMICLADMPGTTAALADRLLAAFAQANGARIVVPVDADGRQGNPVIWPRRLFDPLREVEGDRGGKDMLTAQWNQTVRVPVDDATVFDDVDTPDGLAAWTGSGRGGRGA